MKKIFTAVFLLVAMGMAAQETYQNAELMTEDLGGTARYVGMGGAMDALGADISVIGTNPAGIGLFRKSTGSVSFSVGSQKNGGNNFGGSKTNMNFDQAGIVISMPSGDRQCFNNFAINYHKSSNFNQILSAVGSLNNNCSQNKTSWMKQNDGTTGTYMDNDDYVCVNNNTGSQVDYLYYNTLMLSYDDENYWLDYNDASDYTIDRDRKGYIGEYDFNFSGNIYNRVYWGITLGLKDVHYKNNTIYSENLVAGQANDLCGNVIIDDCREITGLGMNVKFGLILRPVESNPFRVGVSIATPTWYNLTTDNETGIKNGTPYGAYETCTLGESYDFRLVTPWQFGLSLGTTVGSQLAVGASFDFADYSSSKSQIKDGTRYDYWDDTYTDDYTNDRVMNKHTDKTLRGVSTIKLGVEYKPIPELAVRMGYNYVSPMYKSSAYRDLSLNSLGTYYSSTTDFTNWSSTNRVTAGLGFLLNDFYLDLAYQYSCTKGDFEPFRYTDCVTRSLSVENVRHQAFCTLGYRF